MKKLISILIIIITFSFSYSQTRTKRLVSNSMNSFKSGEWLRFRVHYGFFNASEIEIELEKKKLNSHIFLIIIKMLLTTTKLCVLRNSYYLIKIMNCFITDDTTNQGQIMGLKLQEKI